MKPIFYFIIAALLLFVDPVPVSAAFPPRAETPVIYTGANQLSVKKSILPFGTRPQKSAANENNTPGLLSFIFGIVGMICLFSGILTFVSPAPAAAAVVLGAIGITRRINRGLAIAGFVLGTLVVSVALLFLLAIMLTGGF